MAETALIKIIRDAIAATKRLPPHIRAGIRANLQTPWHPK